MLAIYTVLLCEVILVIFGIYLVYSWLTQTPFYPSSVRKLHQLIQSGEIKLPESAIHFIDIGSGDGRFVTWAAKQGYQAHGIEFNPFLTLWSRLKILLRRQGDRAQIFNKNFKNHDFSQYNFAYLYIFSEHMDEIKDKLFKEMKTGSIIITNTFNFKDVQEDSKVDRFYVYYVK